MPLALGRCRMAEDRTVTLALDTGTKTGWAIKTGTMLHSGVQDFQHDAKRESPGMRFLRFSRWLHSMMDSHPITLVVYEQPHQRGGGATMVGVGLVATLQAVCAERGVEHQSVHSGTLKKFATGKGNASKEEMVKACPKAVTDDNESDAIWLLAYSENDQ